jgi:hypothetical protein
VTFSAKLKASTMVVSPSVRGSTFALPMHDITLVASPANPIDATTQVDIRFFSDASANLEPPNGARLYIGIDNDLAG